MKKFLVVLILIFTLQTPSQADDIRDFQIDGMSIGDSLLDYFTLDKIKESLKNPTFYKNNKFVVIFINKISSEYERIQVTIKPDDNNYTIYSIDGILDFDKKIDECNKKRADVIKDLESLFQNFKRVDEDSKFEADKSGQSFTYGTWFFLKTEGHFSITCTKMGQKVREENGWTDELSINVSNKEFENFLKLAEKI